MSYNKGIAICTFNRADKIVEVIDAVMNTKPSDARVIICDDGSIDGTYDVVRKSFPYLPFITGQNLGVGANKNRAIFAMKNCDFLCILEDDLIPTEPEWFQTYQEFCLYTNIHHFCRVQDKQIDEIVPDFSAWCTEKLKLTPIYGPTPRGDLTFVSNLVIRKVGAIHPEFVGVGHAHGHWSDRIFAAGLINHPNKWIDIAEAAAKFKQVGDTEGGRWNFNKDLVKEQIKRNSVLRKMLGTDMIYIEPFLP